MVPSGFNCRAFGKPMPILFSHSFLFLALLIPESAIAAEAGYGLEGAWLAPIWVLPLAGIFFLIALMPLLVVGLWHEHYGKVSLFWALAALVSLAALPSTEPHNVMSFWPTEASSNVLNNASTYLIFFTLAGGGAFLLQGPLKNALAAICAGAVFIGAITYIGNAPNFMVKSIAERNGGPMSSFFSYIG